MTAPVASTGSVTASVSVVVADDDGMVREALAQLIGETPGLEVVGTADDADAALVLIDAHRPDVIVVDVNMPGGGGPRVAAETSQLSPDTRIVALSARGDRAAREAMADAGACRYLVKGHPDVDVIDVIWEVVDSTNPP